MDFNDVGHPNKKILISAMKLKEYIIAAATIIGVNVVLIT